MTTAMVKAHEAKPTTSCTDGRETDASRTRPRGPRGWRRRSRRRRGRRFTSIVLGSHRPVVLCLSPTGGKFVY
jgi:hypothetical protein